MHSKCGSSHIIININDANRVQAAKTRQQKSAAVKRYNEKNHEVKRSCSRDKRRRIDDLAPGAAGSCRTIRHEADEESLRYHKTANRVKDGPEQTC